MDQSPLSRLDIPSPASAASPSALISGRPGLWTHSSQRKICRLYLYTTLKINEILAVVYHAQNSESTPGKDSAQKKLKELLDKEYRWLKPIDEQDMARRYTQLEQSPTRSNLHAQWPSTHPHSRSTPPPFVMEVAVSPQLENDTQFVNQEMHADVFWTRQDAVSPAISFSPSSTTIPGPSTHSTGFLDPVVSPGLADGRPVTSLMRQSSIASTATDHTTGTFNRILPNYPETYVNSVRKLVKRYTAPLGQRMSVLEGMVPRTSSWYEDADAPTCQPTRPFPLPSDFLTLEIQLQRRAPCFQDSEEHRNRWCLCYVTSEAHEPVWVTSDGPTSSTINVLAFGIPPEQAGWHDVYGNNFLHLLAARGQTDVLLSILRLQNSASAVNARNSAGQTFLHVLEPLTMDNMPTICEILDFLAQTTFGDNQRFDFQARDHYGRTIFHILLAADLPGNLVELLLGRYNDILYAPRDAFKVMLVRQDQISYDQVQGSVAQQSQSTQSDEANPEAAGYSREARLIELVRSAYDNPQIEDAEGRNALHCLAMASLSKTSLLNKADPSTRTSPPRPKRRKEGAQEMAQEFLDSSLNRLDFRRKIAQNLLADGVNPNHYDLRGNTPLMAFAAELPEDDDYKTGPTILELLLDHGAEINARNRAGETALHIAVRCGRKLAVRTLVDRGANVHVRDAAGRSLLAVADIKMKGTRDDDPKAYAHLEACRAHLSGKAHAVQEPTVFQEWQNMP